MVGELDELLAQDGAVAQGELRERDAEAEAAQDAAVGLRDALARVDTGCGRP